MRHALVRISMAFFLGVLIAGTMTAADKKVKWTSLMDGKTLHGWHAVGAGKWVVEDGAFVGHADKAKLYGLLVSDKTYDDFTVKFKFKCLAGDSGFYIRTIIKQPDEAHGLQIQVGLPESGVGGIYDSYGRGWVDKPPVELEKRIVKKDDWNDVVISAHGGDVVVHVNGVKTAELKGDPSRPAGHLAMQMHSGNLMRISFKDIEINED